MMIKSTTLNGIRRKYNFMYGTMKKKKKKVVKPKMKKRVMKKSRYKK